jgi:hypothetical protein
MLGGCGQPPGFELSWRIADSLGDAPMLTAAKQCSDVGIFSVRVTIRSGDVVVSIDEHPCFSGVVEGPPLEPGEYTIEVEGLRRNGEPWPFDPDVDLAADRIAHDSESVVIIDGPLPSIEVVLLAPPECDDGIDNDRDGVVDGQDPGCEVLPLSGAPRSESNDADDTLFQLAVRFLDSPAVKPFNVGVQNILLELDGELLAQVPSSQLDYAQSPFRLPLLARDLEGETPDLQITAMGADGPLTETQTLAVTSAYVNEVIDFGSEAFLQPIVEPLAFLFDPTCSPGGQLVLDSMRVRILDENGDPLVLDTLSGNTIGGSTIVETLAGPDLDGWFTFGCPVSMITSAPLTWGRYTIEAQARLASVTCFSTPITDLTPQPASAQTIALERVLNDGQPACPECSKDLDCVMQAGTICDDGLCVPKVGP